MGDVREILGLLGGRCSHHHTYYFLLVCVDEIWDEEDNLLVQESMKSDDGQVPLSEKEVHCGDQFARIRVRSWITEKPLKFASPEELEVFIIDELN